MNRILFLFVVGLWMAQLGLSSPGDRDPNYRRCIFRCNKKICQSPEQEQKERLKETQTIFEEWLGWGCMDECKYQCMHQAREAREKRGRHMLQYHGKWPFERYWGLQEPASVLFSLFNIIPHAYFVSKYLNFSPSSHSPSLLLHALMGIMAFSFSAIFHSRDFPLTEMLDYSFAFLFIISLFAAMLSQVLASNPQKKKTLYISLFVLSLFALSHLYYLFFIHFDYGYNMKVIVIISALVSIFAIVFGFQRKWQNGSWKVPLSCFITLPLGLIFELLDFPPLYLVLDAHACWHAATPFVFFLFYSYFIQEMSSPRFKDE